MEEEGESMGEEENREREEENREDVYGGKEREKGRGGKLRICKWGERERKGEEEN